MLMDFAIITPVIFLLLVMIYWWFNKEPQKNGLFLCGGGALSYTMAINFSALAYHAFLICVCLIAVHIFCIFRFNYRA